jgi:apolipoprotein N-acyltransferase
VVSLYWVSHSLFFDIKSFFWLVPLCFLGLPLFMAGVMGGAAYLLPWWKEPHLGKRFAWLVLWWIGGETLISFMAPQFPWPILGYTWMAYPEIAQLGAFIGVYGLSALTIVFGFWLYVFTYKAKTRAFFLSLVVGPILLGMVLWNFGEERMAKPYGVSTNIRIVQPNIPQVQKWDAREQIGNLETLIRLSQTFNPSFFPQAIIWPEAAIGFYLDESLDLRKKLAAMLGPESYLILGVVRRNIGARKLWNNISILDSEGTIVAIHDKYRLVPFGEYFPFRSALETVFPKGTIRKVTVGLMDFSSGPGVRTLNVPFLPSFSPLVCYEIIFSGQVSEGQKRPKWLVNLTNDAWFGDSVGPYQHLRMAQMRAIEEGLPVVRVANTGISALIDPYGRILSSLGLNEQGIIDCQLPNPLPPTVFSAYGTHLESILIWLLVLSSLGFWILNPNLIIRRKLNDLWTKAR